MTAARRRAPRTPEQRLAQSVQSLIPGSRAGSVANASPVNSRPALAVRYSTGQRQLLAFSNTGALSVQTGTHRMYVEHGSTILAVRAAVGTAPTGAAILVDVNKNGTTIFTTQANRPSIAAAGFTALAAAVNVPALAPGDYLTVDVDQVGSTVAGSDLTVTVEVAG